MSITTAYFPTINYSAAHLQEENDLLALYAYTQLEISNKSQKSSRLVTDLVRYSW
jgi:hypothetical protein